MFRKVLYNNRQHHQSQSYHAHLPCFAEVKEGYRSVLAGCFRTFDSTSRSYTWHIRSILTRLSTSTWWLGLKLFRFVWLSQLRQLLSQFDKLIRSVLVCVGTRGPTVHQNQKIRPPIYSIRLIRTIPSSNTMDHGPKVML